MFTESINILAMVILGGMGNLFGVILGAALIVALPELFREFEQYRLLAFGFMLMVLMVFRPQGLLTFRGRRQAVPEEASEMAPRAPPLRASRCRPAGERASYEARAMLQQRGRVMRFGLLTGAGPLAGPQAHQLNCRTSALGRSDHPDSEGLYCPLGGFHIDPWRPVERAVITHAHGDHARRGSRRYHAARSGVACCIAGSAPRRSSRATSSARR